MKKINFKNIYLTLLLIAVALVFQSCLVSRCRRPQIIGYVYDSITRKPVENCKVGEVLTDQKGYFQLEELRYSQWTFAGSEAPPLMINEFVDKDGYEKKSIEAYSSHGGGNRKGSSHNADTIFLKKVLLPSDPK
ncbi:hypothetical protein [Flavobacterium sp. CLA17]|uniref:hypothetical protein n=1 Tax=Flavobacterium sp. CLA17 TaxID=2724135 RepID=UPI001491E9D7|nr:hypothetical protein [Flavobacterium sp. CLA17]QSB25219.1 hypothetical protein HAV12_012615 [Flavobacterium sp. CLA17]